MMRPDALLLLALATPTHVQGMEGEGIPPAFLAQLSPGIRLKMAILKPSLKDASRILEEGADPHEVTCGETPLHAAVHIGSLLIMRLLLDTYGVDTETRSIYEHTALHEAVLEGNVITTRLLLKHNADPEAELHRALRSLQYATHFRWTHRTVRVLLELGTQMMPEPPPWSFHCHR